MCIRDRVVLEDPTGQAGHIVDSRAASAALTGIADETGAQQGQRGAVQALSLIHISEPTRPY